MDYQSTVVSPTGVTKIGKTVSAELPQVKDQSFNMRDRLNDMLATEKYNLVNYQIAINELINPQLRQVVDKNCTRLQGLHDQFLLNCSIWASIRRILPFILRSPMPYRCSPTIKPNCRTNKAAVDTERVIV